MRVVGGELGGRRLHGPRGPAVRPTADRVREAVFSILGELDGARALDLYCGTGALGIEALSRGAASATLVDANVVTARRNVRELELAERARVVRADALRWLRRAPRDGFDLVFCDPPYKLANRIAPQLDPLISRCLASGGRAVVESAAREPLRLSLPLVRERRYGDTLIAIYAR